MYKDFYCELCHIVTPCFAGASYVVGHIGRCSASAGVELRPANMLPFRHVAVARKRHVSKSGSLWPEYLDVAKQST